MSGLVCLLVLVCLAALLLLVLGAGKAAAVSPQTTVVVANSNMSGSVELAQFYVEARDIPLANLIVVNVSNQETIDREQYNATEAAIRAGIVAAGLQNSVDVLVPVFGLPLKVRDPRGGGYNGTQASVDAELSLMFSLAEADKPGREDFPPYYWLNSSYNRSANYDLVLVMRIDGPTVEAARRLIDHALAAEARNQAGWAYFDRQPGFEDETPSLQAYGEHIGAAFELALERGLDAALENTDHAIGQAGARWDPRSSQGAEPANGTYPNGTDSSGDVSPWFYWGWIDSRYDDHFDWPLGAVGQHVHSTNAYSLRDDHWLAGAIADNLTATAGHVWEPYVDSASHPELVLEHLLDGYTVVEAFYRGTQYFGWNNIFVGDPLYTPVRVGLSLELVAGAGQSVLPGGQLNITVNLTNHGPVRQRFVVDLETESNPPIVGWEPLSILLEAGQARQLAITLNISPDLLAHRAGVYTLALKVWMEGREELAQTISFNLSLTPVARFELIAPLEVEVVPGEQYSVTLVVRNLGNVDDEFELYLPVPAPLEVTSLEVIAVGGKLPYGNAPHLRTGYLAPGELYGLQINLVLPVDSGLFAPTTLSFRPEVNSTVEAGLTRNLTLRFVLIEPPAVVDDNHYDRWVRLVAWFGLGLIASLAVRWWMRKRVPR